MCLLILGNFRSEFLHLGDLTVVGAMVGIGLGRIANFINGELMGRVCSPDSIFAVKFPQDIYRWIGYHPEKLRTLEEPARLVGVAPSDWSLWVHNIQMYKNKFYALTDQIIASVQNGNTEMIEALRPLLEPRKPGVIGSVFIMIYSVGGLKNSRPV